MLITLASSQATPPTPSPLTPRVTSTQHFRPPGLPYLGGQQGRRVTCRCGQGVEQWHFSPAANQSCRLRLSACHEPADLPTGRPYNKRRAATLSQNVMDKHRCSGVWGIAIAIAIPEGRSDRAKWSPLSAS